MKWGSRQNARTVGPDARDVRGIVRRMIVRFTDSVLWQLTGHLIEGARETVSSEVFSGIGFYARPRSGVKTAEAVLLRVGDAEHVVVVATRDEDLRALWSAELDGDDGDLAAMFNRATIVLIKPDETVEIRRRGGTARKIAFADELQALATDFYDHIHGAAGSPTTKAIAEFSLPDPPGAPLVNPGQPGTEVLKGE